MKKVIINYITDANSRLKKRNDPCSFEQTIYIESNNPIKISDGHHTMDELYEHRITLFIALCRKFQSCGGLGDVRVWRSKLHSDRSSFEGWFVLGIGKEKGEQITYHLPISRWDECEFAEEMEKAPEFDGHTPADVLKRIENL